MKEETYYLSCRKYTKNINPRVVISKHNRSMIQSNCAIYNSKKSRFINEHQANGLLSDLGIKTPLNKVPLLNILFNLKDKIKCTYVINKNVRDYLLFIM